MLGVQFQSFFLDACTTEYLPATAEWTDFYSPNYPDNYNDNANCDFVWTSDGAYISVEVVEVELENEFDSLTVYDGGDSSAEVLAVLTGSSNPSVRTTVTSSGTMLYAVFVTDYQTSRKGFHLRYKSKSRVL